MLLLDSGTKELCRLATSLADNCPRPDLLEAEQWLKPLLLLMADGIARNTPAQLQSVLTTLDAVIRTKQRKVGRCLGAAVAAPCLV